MTDIIINALAQVGQAALLFVATYLANVLFGLYFNIRVLREEFSWRRLLLSLVKIVTFTAGMALLTVAVAALPVFAQSVGWEIPPEYVEVFSVVAIVFTFLRVALKYGLEALNKLYSILNLDGETFKTDELEDIRL